MASPVAPSHLPRVFAMARPARCGRERALVQLASAELGARGSMRRQGRAVAIEVARLAVLFVRQEPDDLGVALQLAEAQLTRPGASALACDAEIDTAAIVRAEAVRQFEARGCRNLSAKAAERADAELVKSVADRLAERFRRALK